MNFVASDRHTASYSASSTTPTHAVLIPSYNTGRRLYETVATIRRLGWPVWVIIDGSTDGTAEGIAGEAAVDPDLHVSVLPQNRGKGAAILHGLELVRMHDVTHVVTVDADGQHSTDHIQTLVALSLAHPEAMILGVPQFDASAPAVRVAGHQVSKFCANLVTLRSGIGNPLFGFRVYPVVPLLQVFAKPPRCDASILTPKPPSGCPGTAFPPSMCRRPYATFVAAMAACRISITCATICCCWECTRDCSPL
jgi:glycosyltransferase involved in cell wall biosynthesis